MADRVGHRPVRVARPPRPLDGRERPKKVTDPDRCARACSPGRCEMAVDGRERAHRGGARLGRRPRTAVPPAAALVGAGRRRARGGRAGRGRPAAAPGAAGGAARPGETRRCSRGCAAAAPSRAARGRTRSSRTPSPPRGAALEARARAGGDPLQRGRWRPASARCACTRPTASGWTPASSSGRRRDRVAVRAARATCATAHTPPPSALSRPTLTRCPAASCSPSGRSGGRPPPR